jgi:hypothetical protein
MIEAERTAIAEALLAVIFSLRPDNSPASQAWVLSVATTAMARAILASVGPAGDATELFDVATAQVRKVVLDTQSKAIREHLAAPVAGARRRPS